MLVNKLERKFNLLWFILFFILSFFSNCKNNIENYFSNDENKMDAAFVQFRFEIPEGDAVMRDLYLEKEISLLEALKVLKSQDRIQCKILKNNSQDVNIQIFSLMGFKNKKNQHWIVFLNEKKINQSIDALKLKQGDSIRFRFIKDK